MPARKTESRRIYRALVLEEKTDLSWDEAIRRWSRADDERDPAGDATPAWAEDVEAERARETAEPEHVVE